MNTPQDADAYYRDLTERNRGLIPDGVQQRLRAARVLVVEAAARPAGRRSNRWPASVWAASR